VREEGERGPPHSLWPVFVTYLSTSLFPSPTSPSAFSCAERDHNGPTSLRRGEGRLW